MTTYCNRPLAEIASAAEILEQQNIHAVEDRDRHTVCVSGFIIPCLHAAHARRTAAELEKALAPLLKKHVRRLKKSLGEAPAKKAAKKTKKAKKKGAKKGKKS